MVFTNLNKDSITNIASFLNENDSSSLCLSSQIFSSVLLKTLSLDFSMSMNSLRLLMNKYQVDILKISDLENPHLWITNYPQKLLILQNCEFKFFDPLREIVETIEIIIYGKTKKINRKKFPFLNSITFFSP